VNPSLHVAVHEPLLPLVVEPHCQIPLSGLLAVGLPLQSACMCKKVRGHGKIKEFSGDKMLARPHACLTKIHHGCNQQAAAAANQPVTLINGLPCRHHHALHILQDDPDRRWHTMTIISIMHGTSQNHICRPDGIHGYNQISSALLMNRLPCKKQGCQGFISAGSAVGTSRPYIATLRNTGTNDGVPLVQTNTCEVRADVKITFVAHIARRPVKSNNR